MTQLLAVSIALRACATVLAGVLLVRLRDWRLGLLMAALALMTARQAWTLVGAGSAFVETNRYDELPGLAVSVLALLFVALSGRGLERYRREVADRQRAQNELRLALQDLRAEEARLRLVADRMPTVVWTTDEELRFTSSSGQGLAALGLETDEAVGQPLEQFFAGMPSGVTPFTAHRRALAGESVGYEMGWQGRTYSCRVEPLEEDGVAMGTLGVALDITERKRTEEALRRSEERYRAFLSRTTEAIWRADLETPLPVGQPVEEQVERLLAGLRVSECNDAGVVLRRLDSAGQVLGRGIDGMIPPDRARALLTCFVEGGYRLDDFETSVEVEDSTLVLLGNLVGIVEDGRLLHVWGAQRDVTDHRRAQEALARSEARFRRFFEDSRDAIFLSTPDGRLLDINPAGVEMLGFDSREEVLSCDIGRDLYWRPEDRVRLVERFDDQEFVKDLPVELRRRDGKRLSVLETTIAERDEAGELVAFQGILRDVTERMELERQVRQAVRMEAVGRLAAGVAHDFNNVLTVINGRSDLLLARLDEEPELAQEVGEIKQAGQRAALLTRQLLALARRPLVSVQRLQINEVLADMERLLRRTVREDVTVELTLDEEVWPVRADRALLELVVLNLVSNARDAMPRGGSLVLATGNQADEPRLERLGVGRGDWVVLKVSDTGVGIDEALQEHVFEPFFTTKKIGAGTGLGLATTYSVVSQSGGRIRMESEPGVGTTFWVYLPRAEAEVEHAPRPRLRAGRAATETLLVVEDEEALRRMLVELLRRRGYEVAEAEDGIAGLALSESWPDVREDGGSPVDLLITDVVMPRMGGVALAERLRDRWPSLPVLFMSGYSELAGGAMAATGVFVQKPFSPALLLRRVRAILDGGPFEP